MSTNLHDQADVEDRLWNELKKVRYGMLGIVEGGPVRHFQPMTAFAEREDGVIWFFTRTDTDMARDLANNDGAKAMFTVQARDQDFQACIGGRLSLTRDQTRIDKYWNPVVAAWYPDGKDDPRLTLVKFDANSAAVWISDAGPTKFAWEIAKANMSKKEPDLGGRAEVRL
jgi:general stress protein 26